MQYTSDPGRSRRLRRIAVASVAVTVAVTSAFLLGPLGRTVALPGPLSTNHAHLRDRCEACHLAGASAIQSAFQGLIASTLSLEQNKLCVECHSPGARSAAPHSWSAAALASATSVGGSVTASGPLPVSLVSTSSVPTGPAGELACATCHREHRGRFVSLTELSDQQCQVCHGERFAGFADGHPDFELRPLADSRSVRFDHASHISKHFPDGEVENPPRECTDCHVPDATGSGMQLEGFERICGDCHGAEIRGAARVESGLAVLGLPGVDTLTLEEAGIDIGAWPADSAISEAALTPFMQLLISGEDELERYLALDPLDLTGATEVELAAVGRVARAIQRVLKSVSIDGHAVIEQRLRTTVGVLDDRTVTALLGGLGVDSVRTALDAWALDSEPSQDLAVEAGTPEEDPGREAWVSRGGWFRQDTDFTLRYRPAGHGDHFLRAWLDVSSAASETTAEGRGAERALEEIFAALSDKAAVGLCTKCHVVEPSGRHGRRIRWQAEPGATSGHGLTHFSHAPHFAAIAETGCQTCHEQEAVTEEDRGSDFRAIRPATCSACHSVEGAPARCLTCHVYHERDTPSVLPRAPLVERAR